MPDSLSPYLSPAMLVAVSGLIGLGLLWILYRRFYRPRRTLKSVLAEIAHDRLSNIVIPKADEGEILIDRLLLTASGLLVLDIKDVQGVVFGSNKMQDWTVIGTERRYTFTNPQAALYDRIAAVRQIVREVPVSGRILFLDGADFTKGVPDLACDLDELQREFAAEGATAAQIDAFKPHWERVRRVASLADQPGTASQVAAVGG